MWHLLSPHVSNIQPLHHLLPPRTNKLMKVITLEQISKVQKWCFKSEMPKSNVGFHSIKWILFWYHGLRSTMIMLEAKWKYTLNTRSKDLLTSNICATWYVPSSFQDPSCCFSQYIYITNFTFLSANTLGILVHHLHSPTCIYGSPYCICTYSYQPSFFTHILQIFSTFTHFRHNVCIKYSIPSTQTSHHSSSWKCPKLWLGNYRKLSLTPSLPSPQSSSLPSLLARHTLTIIHELPTYRLSPKPTLLVLWCLQSDFLKDNHIVYRPPVMHIYTAVYWPVPDPIAPRKSASTESAPMQRPPKAAAVGM